MDIQTLKQRYDIIGNDPRLMLALNKAIQVAPTDLSILITGESGVGKDVFSRIIHENSLRKHVRQGRARRLTAAPYSSTRSANCHWPCR